MSFPRYKKYKPSGVEWLGDVPEHWEPIRFKNVFREKGFNSGVHLQAGSISFGRVVFKDDEAMNEGTKATYQEVLRSEFLINPINLNYDLKSLRTALSEIATCVSPAYIVLQAKIDLDRSFMKHQLSMFDVRHMKTLGAGVRQTITFSDIGVCFTQLPPLHEQTAIAAFLDRETGKIDELVEEQRLLMELLKEKRQAVISHAVTQGLNPKAPMKSSGIDWLGDIPEHWAIPPIFTRYQAVLGKMVDEKKKTGTHPIPYLRNADVNWDWINASDLPVLDIGPDELDRFSIRPGDLLICEGGAGIGQTAIWAGELDCCAFQKALHRLRPWKGDENPRFLYYCMRFVVETGVILASGISTIPHLTGEQLKRFRFPKPPLAEQNEITNFLDAETANLDTLTAEAQRAIELLQERRTALISAAVTGQIDVRTLPRN